MSESNAYDHRSLALRTLDSARASRVLGACAASVLALAMAACSSGSTKETSSEPLCASYDAGPVTQAPTENDAGSADAAAPDAAPEMTTFSSDPTSNIAWFAAGDNPTAYDMGLDSATTLDGKGVAHIKSKATGTTGFGTWMARLPVAPADAFRGKRVRYTAQVKSTGVTDWSGLWMRVDGEYPFDAGAPRMLAFDNMENRPITGTTEWKPYSIVLDVPANFTEVYFGILVVGDGEAWIGPATLEVVDASVPLTGT